MAFWVAVSLALVGVATWYAVLPRLRVFVDPDLTPEVDWDAFRAAFHGAGVHRVELVVLDSREAVKALALGPQARSMDIALMSPRGRNPLLDAEALQAGKTGPGHTEGRVANVYPDEIARFLWKHKDRYRAAGTTDWLTIRQHLYTNTAVHEVWHATANSHSHNPVDMDSVMYQDPGAGALSFGTRNLPFTRGHRDRLVEIFRPVLPWQDGLDRR